MRHAHLAHTTVQAAISSAQHYLNTAAKDHCGEGEGEGVENGERKENGAGNMNKGLFSNFIANLMVVLNQKEKEKEGSRLYNFVKIR